MHRKFIVGGFNGSNPVVYCGSSTLAETWEQLKGDNLLVIYDAVTRTSRWASPSPR
jgi:hypothetical protein